MGIPDHKFGDQRGNAGGKQHGVDIRAQLFLLHQAVNDYAQHGGPHIHNVDAPGAEAQCQNKGQIGNVGRCGLQSYIERQAGKAHQGHIEKGCRVAAHGKIVGGDFAGIADDLPQPCKHGSPVRHAHRGNEKGRREQGKYQLQKVAFRQRFDFFHIFSSKSSGGGHVRPPQKNVRASQRPPPHASSAHWW